MSAEDATQAELINAYRNVREQLQSTQLAIAANRLEADANARVQTAITDKLESIRSTMDLERERHRIETERSNAERERQRQETDRANAERDRQQAELQRFTRTTFWIALAFGGIGVLSVIIVPLLQWRALKQVVDFRNQPAGLLAPATGGLLQTDHLSAADETVGLSNRRLLSVIDRMEQRIFELEHTTAHPLPSTSASPFIASDSRRPEAIAEHLERIGMLMNRGRVSLEGNRPREALTCFDEVLKLDLKNAEALVKRGAALEQLKQDEEAIQCYDRAIKIDPKLTLAYLHKGGVCNRLERYEEALHCYEQALRAEADGAPAVGSRAPLPGPWPASGRSISAG
ncbi:MAG: tetratricopeptide repeat protein [Opitutaceae bacterium]